MKSVTAIQLRQSVRKILTALKKNNEPLLLCQGKEPAAVIISLEDYKTKFYDKVIAAKRRKVIAEIKLMTKRKTAAKITDKLSTNEILRELREGKA